MPSYEQVWEHDGPWPGGAALLGDLVHYYRDRSVQISAGPRRGSYNLHLPLPLVYTERGDYTDLTAYIPPDRVTTFLDCVMQIVQARAPHLDRLRQLYNLQITHMPTTIRQMNRDLLNFEQQSEALGQPRLWRIMSGVFGFGEIVPVRADTIRFRDTT